MRPLQQLDNRTLSAVLVALDNYQRHQQTNPEAARPFLKILDALIGPVEDLDSWGIRSQVSSEQDRRIRHATVKVTVPDSISPVKLLTPKQCAVLRLIGQGHRSEVVADLLSISYHTLSNHKRNIAAKLNLGSVRDLQKFAHDNLELL